MRTTSTLSVLFWIHSHRVDKNNLSTVNARITVSGKKVIMSLNQKVDVDLWDSKRQRVKGTGRTSKTINNYLDEVRSELVFCYRDLKLESRVLTPQLIKARYLGEDKKVHSLKDIFEYHNDKMGIKLATKTLCHYKTSQKYILSYISKEYKKEDIYLQDLDYEFVIGFESFLRSYQPRHYQGRIGNNAVMKHIQRLRRMTTLAYHMEWIARDPFVKFKPKIEKKEREFLTKKELERIEQFSTSFERLTVVKDLFVFGCYTGICYGDIMDLTKNNIVRGIDGNQWLMANRNKTGTPFKIPILPVAEKLIHKYQNHHRTHFNGKLLPSISNQKLNSYLKEVADLCNIEKNLTFHMARHTFATTVTLTNGVPIETVSKLLGHTKLATTQIYARVVERKLSEDMMLLRQKLG
ncbi:site-specific integrase [Aggregatimonas sangjinii]|uniref:Site-specific integrase n=1 Tax=Aggregatimonas sangjinii TaxID=2583587 RepID=A0A5B7SPX3_9FLAO|nr:site-specific integrase [Aggregatimonas sangjinii]QCX00577.1 site-specific integrase [Aggregatimonas sangjinii]